MTRRERYANMIGVVVPFLGLLAAQGIVGLVQYYNALPAEVVWIHASLPAVLWVALVWSWLAAAPAPARQPTPPAAQPEPALVR